MTTSPVVRGRLKWFNGPKGFGFIITEDTGQDAFLHVTTLRRAGISYVGEGAVFLCRTGAGKSGLKVSEIVELVDTGRNPFRIGGHAGAVERSSGGDEDSNDIPCVVKWYKPDKGFGFVTPENGGPDIFIHRSCLQRRNLDTLESGRRLLVRVRNTQKGIEAENFTFTDAGDRSF